jgi:hypothetical protein
MKNNTPRWIIFHPRRKYQQAGFTLIEIMVVVVIMFLKWSSWYRFLLQNLVLHISYVMFNY